MFIAVGKTRRPVRRAPARRSGHSVGQLYRRRLPGRRVFFRRNTRHMRRRSRLVDWLGAAAMLAAMISWGALLSLLGS
jgi:hypothetical protein